MCVCVCVCDLTSHIVPHSLRPQLHGKRVLSLHKMPTKNHIILLVYIRKFFWSLRVGMTADIASTANIATHETDPQVLTQGERGTVT